jgi:hypothetical protein
MYFLNVLKILSLLRHESVSTINRTETRTFVWTKNQIDIALTVLSKNVHLEQLCR